MNLLVHMSYLGLLLSVFARQLCLPVPAILFLMTAGALAAHGQLHLSLVLGAGVAGCLLGDLVWFGIGRRWGNQVLRIICSFNWDPNRCSQRAREVFGHWGLRALLLAKFIPGLDGVTPPLAGAEGSPITSFLLFDGIGSLLWSAAYTALGYVFAEKLTIAFAWVEQFGKILAACVGIPLTLYICWRAVIILRTMRQLRLRQMGTALLARSLAMGDQIVLIDLLGFEDGEITREGIAEAVRIDPRRLRTSSKIMIPNEVKVVLYCSSRNAFTSARVAIAMRKKGISNVWLLEGGLKAWKAQGLPTTSSLRSREELMERLNIVLPGR